MLRACQPLLASASQLEEAGFGEEQACVVLGPEEGEVLEGEDEEVVRPSRRAAPPPSRRPLQPPIFVELLFMTEEACEEARAAAAAASGVLALTRLPTQGSAKAIQALKDASFDAEIFEDGAGLVWTATSL